MVLGLWIASLLDDWRIGLRSKTVYQATFLDTPSADISSRLGFVRGFIELLMTLGFLALLMWVAGYFVVSGSDAATQSFGISRMNILAPFDAQQWSYVLPSLPDAQGIISDVDMSARTYENFMYWGVGMLVIVLLAVILSGWNRIRGVSKDRDRQEQHPHIVSANHEKDAINLSWQRHGILYLVLMGFTLLALSNQLALGPWSWSFPIPEPLYQMASMYRASSRFFWPLWYAIVLVGVTYLSRIVSPKGITALLVLCATLQIADTHSGWKSIRTLTMKPVRLLYVVYLLVRVILKMKQDGIIMH
jgi:hypothetical protein